jgi:hypothetical protein
MVAGVVFAATMPALLPPQSVPKTLVSRRPGKFFSNPAQGFRRPVRLNS